MLRFDDEVEAENFCLEYNLPVEDGELVLHVSTFTRTQLSFDPLFLS